MNTLLIDTTSRKIIIALYTDKLSVIRQDSLMNHSHYTINMIKQIIEDNSLSVNDINRIIVVNGPGSFTGIRIGVVIAKTLAYTLNTPIMTISSLQALAVDQKKIMTLRYDSRDNYYYGIYDNNQIITEGLDSIVKINKLIEDEKIIEIRSYDKVDIENVIISDYDILKVIKYVSNTKNINPHLVNPYYLKQTSAEANLND